MTMPEKLQILIRRKGITKTEVAKICGITYRTLANYISEGRRPRPHILTKLAGILDTTPDFLRDNNQGLVLTSEERFIFNATSHESAVNAGVGLLFEAKCVFGDAGLTEPDKQALFSCLSEVYFASKNKITTHE